jgi:hypothetical protein
MCLEIAPSGGKWWRFKYRLAGKERRISLGVYPDVGLAEARERREQARKYVAAGVVRPGTSRALWRRGPSSICRDNTVNAALATRA